MGVSLKTEKRRSQQTSLVCHCPVFSFRPWVRRAEGLPGMTTEDLHGHERRSAPPALLPLTCMVFASLVSQGGKTDEDCSPMDKEKREKLREYMTQFHLDQ